MAHALFSSGLGRAGGGLKFVRREPKRLCFCLLAFPPPNILSWTYTWMRISKCPYLCLWNLSVSVNRKSEFLHGDVLLTPAQHDSNNWSILNRRLPKKVALSHCENLDCLPTGKSRLLLIFAKKLAVGLCAPPTFLVLAPRKLMAVTPNVHRYCI